MMSMSFPPDALSPPDPSKSAFLELGHGLPASQQHFSGLSHNVFPAAGLRSGGHPQHDGAFPPPGACHYNGPLSYSYPAPLSGPAPAYISYQQNNFRNQLGDSRKDEDGEYQRVTTQSCQEILTNELLMMSNLNNIINH